MLLLLFLRVRGAERRPFEAGCPVKAGRLFETGCPVEAGRLVETGRLVDAGRAAAGCGACWVGG